MWDNSSNETLVVLDPEECWIRLGTESLGRLALCVGGEIDIYPVNFVVDNHQLYFRTAPGSKLLGLSVQPSVAFEVDHFDDEAAFSVVVKGTAERLEGQADIEAADRLPLKPFAPTLKYRWVRIIPTEITGRSFRRAPEPERY